MNRDTILLTMLKVRILLTCDKLVNASSVSSLPIFRSTTYTK